MEIKDNKAIAKRVKNNHEFLFVDRGELKNAVFMAKKRINANPYVERSNLASKKGQIYNFIWENSNPDLLFPGMMCKIHYFDSDELMELNGVLLASNTAIQLNGVSVTSKRHSSTTQMLIFANPAEAEATETQEDSEQSDDWSEYETI